MGQSSMSENYKECFERGSKYEDFVYPILCEEWGVKITPYKTKREQLKGENSFGVEIKFDEKSINSTNLFIEYEERREKKDGTLSGWSPSGIYRGDHFRDNSWLYLIGNYDIFYIFLKKQLKDLHNTRNYGEVPGTTASNSVTSKGFLLPKCEAETLALDIINVKKTSNEIEQPDIHWSIQKPEWM